MEPQVKKTDWNAISITLLIALILSLTAGGAAYYFAYQLTTSRVDTVNSQIQDLQTQVDSIKMSQDEIVGGITADWKTDTNSKYDFSFMYPSSMTLKEGPVNYGDAREYEITSSDGYLYVNVYNMGSQSAEDFVDGYYGLIQSGPSEIQNTTINGNDVVRFFMEMTSSDGTTQGSTVYFFSQGSTGVAIANSGDSTEVGILPIIADTFMFE